MHDNVKEWNDVYAEVVVVYLMHDNVKEWNDVYAEVELHASSRMFNILYSSFK